jgi:hypothetical protein
MHGVHKQRRLVGRKQLQQSPVTLDERRLRTRILAPASSIALARRARRCSARPSRSRGINAAAAQEKENRRESWLKPNPK